MSNYLDLDISMETINNEPQLIQNNEVIVQSLVCLLLTEPGEIEYVPDYGTVITELLSLNKNDKISLELIKMKLMIALNEYEPRAIIKDIQFDFEVDQRALIVKIYFSTVDLPEAVNELIVDLRRRLI